MSVAVGIDLGTSNCSIGIFINDELTEIIPNIQIDDDIMKYKIFKAIAIPNEKLNRKRNNKFDVKRLIGMKYSDFQTQNIVESSPFKIIDDGNNTPVTIVKDNINMNKTKKYIHRK